MKRNILNLLLICILLFFGFDLIAQCPMCKMSAESNMQQGGTAGRGLNTGILYLLALPYLVVGTLVYLFRKNRSRLNQQ